MAEIVRIEGIDIQVATVEGQQQDVFNSPSFLLSKARWVPDQECSKCTYCSSQFSSLRRKHHCRQCGHIFCAKCCFEKMAMPQLGCSTMPERACELCKCPAKFVAHCISRKLPEKLIGVKGLTEMLYNPPGIKKALETGGVMGLVFAAKCRDIPLREKFCTGLNALVTHTTLHPYLLNVGAGKALASIMAETDTANEQLLGSCLSILSVICKSPQLVQRVLSDGLLEPVLVLTSSFNASLSLMALRVLSQLVEDTNTHPFIVKHRNSALNKIFLCTSSPDEQTQEAALKVLAIMALGSDETRQHIAQEDIFSGHCCQRILCGRPENIQVLVNTACLVANMAASAPTQAALKDLVLPLCRLLEDLSEQKALMLHTARGIANFSRHQGHANLLIPYVSNIFSVFVKAVDTGIRYQGLRTMISLMTHFPQQALLVLQHEDISLILLGLASEPRVTKALSSSLQSLAPDSGRI